MSNLANIIKIKRSSTANKPSTLFSGELAYSWGLTPGTSPERLFIGSGDDGSGNATSIDNIGGLYYTRLIDASSAGTLTTNAKSIPILDQYGKINDWLVGNLELTGNTLSTTNGNLNVILSANGTGKVQINTSSNSFTLPTTRTSVNGYVLTANTDGTTSWAQASSSVSLKAGTGTGDSGTDATFSLINDDIEFRGDAKAITTALSVTSGGGHNHYVVTTSARLASTSVTGVASFSSSTFDVSILGDVSVKSGGISNTQLANSSFYIGDISISLGNSSGDVDTLNIDISGNAATATNAGYADSAGYVTEALTLGTNLSFATGSDYDGSAAREIDLASTLTGITSISASGATGSVVLNNGTNSLTFDASGNLVLPNYTLPVTGGTAGQVLTWPATGFSGVLEWADISTSLTIGADEPVAPGNHTSTVNLLSDTFTIAGGTNITTSVDGSTITVNLDASLTGVSIDGQAGSVANALTFGDTGGVALNSTFDGSSPITIDYSSVGAAPKAGSSDITTVGTLTSGSIGTGFTAIPNSALSNSSIEVNGTSFTLGDTGGTITANTTNALANGSNIQTFSFDGSTSGVTVALATDISLASVSANDIEATNLYTSNLWLHDSTIESGNTIGDVVLVANNGGGDKTYTFGGDGNLEVAGKITNVTDPTSPQDAATKAYVDATASGLHIHAPAMVATTVSLTATYDNGTSGVGATLTFASPVNTLDSYSLANEDRILVKNQADAKQNGVYVRTSSTVWTRAVDFNQITEITGADFLFVQKGASGGSTGWVQTDKVVSGVGSSDVTFVQFSAANSYLAGDGIDITGNTIKVKLATNSGLSVSSGSLTISGIAGTAATTGLTYSAGVLQIGTDGTSIGINASGYLEIKSTWVGQSAITTLGTITTGTWTATAIDATHGGTNQTTWAKGDLLYASAANTLSKLAAGTNGQMLQLQDGLPVWADLDGGTYGP